MLFLAGVFSNPEMVKKISCNSVSKQEEADTLCMQIIKYFQIELKVVLLYNHLILMF